MICFTKMHGLGNDYVYIDCTKSKQNIEDESDLAKFVSNRHLGIGSDGLILIKESKVADFKMQMYNYDGSQAEMCGNGIRCVGKYVYDKGLTQKKEIMIETLAGIKILKLNCENKKVKTVCVDMGEPILEASKIPVIADKSPVTDLKIQVLNKTLKFTCVSMGNPHAITFVNEIEDFLVEKYGSIIEKDKHFPNKVNVEFAKIVDKNNIKMRVWERGTGETMACGTGACATAVASIINGYTNKKVTVELLGGNLEIEWKENNHIYMTGPATTVFEGTMNE